MSKLTYAKKFKYSNNIISEFELIRFFKIIADLKLAKDGTSFDAYLKVKRKLP